MGKFRRLFSKFHPRASSESTSSNPTAASPDLSHPTPPGSAVQTTKPASTVTQPKTCPASTTTGAPVEISAALENLPAEIRREILDALDYDSLRALTHASPIFHQQYRLDRKYLLRRCMQRTLGAAAVDACAAYRSSPDLFTDACKRESVAEFLRAYQDRRSSATCSVLDEALTETDIVAIVAFHFTVIEPLLNRFVSWALGYLAKETARGESLHHKPLSTTEAVRVMRAMYRFQLCCNLFHDRRRQRGGFSSESIDVIKLFFCLFEPWEVEEIICIQNFSQHEFDRIFCDIHWDLHPENPRFDDQGRPPTPTGAFDFDNSERRSSYLGGTVMCGFELLHTVLFKMRDHEHLATTMQKNISVLGELFEGAVSEGTQWVRRNEQRSERDLKEQRRDPLPFVGDPEPDGRPSSNCPPLAWTLVWKGTYSNLYGDYLDGEMRRWGYVMWDAARLETEGGTALLSRQWGTDWDPRDTV